MGEDRLRYAIRIQGHLATRRLRHFEGITVRQDDCGDTVIAGCFRDQSALFGLLNWLQSLNVPLVFVQRLEGTSVTEEGEEK
jgi:hypothetical protein